MDTISEKELQDVIENSKLVSKYNTTIDRESAYEKLCSKMENCKAEEALEEEAKSEGKRKNESESEVADTIYKISKNPLVRDVARTATRAALRGILGMLTKK
jgi:predicted GTPase